MPNDSAEADLEAGTASYRAHNLKVPDYFTIANALANGAFVPARTTFTVNWGGPSAPASWSTSDFSFSGLSTQAHIDWSASSEGSTWQSDSTGQVIESAFVGIDRNGVFR